MLVTMWYYICIYVIINFIIGQALAGHKRSFPLAVVLPPPARGPGTLIPSAQRLVWAANPFIYISISIALWDLPKKTLVQFLSENILFCLWSLLLPMISLLWLIIYLRDLPKKTLVQFMSENILFCLWSFLLPIISLLASNFSRVY